MKISSRRISIIVLALLPWITTGMPLSAHALEALSENQMARVSGTGLALGIENMRMIMDSSGYIEALGEDKDYSGDPFQRADVRWYGVSFSAASSSATGTGSTYSGADCGGNNLQCPISTNGVLIPDDNPFVLRAWDYTGTSPQGHQYLTYDGSTSGVPTVFELLLPEWHENLKASFWGEIGIGLNDGIAAEGGADNPAAQSPSDPASGPFLQSRTILDNVSLAGTRVRWFRFSDPDDPTFGLAARLNITGDMHFSVQQHSSSADQLGIVPDFAPDEGVYFKNVATYLPLGMLHYQAMIADQVSSGGDFVLEVGPIPGTPGDGTSSLSAVQKDFYALREDSSGNVNEQGYAPVAEKPSRWHETHGHWRIGDLSTTNGAHSTSDGIYFQGTSDYTAYASRPRQNQLAGDPDNVNCGTFGLQECPYLDQWSKKPDRELYNGNFIEAETNESEVDDGDATQPEPPRPYEGSGIAVTDTQDHVTNIGDVNVKGLLLNELRVTTCSTVNGAC